MYSQFGWKTNHNQEKQEQLVRFVILCALEISRIRNFAQEFQFL